MHWVDIAILTIIGISTILSLFRGFAREILALAGWVAAFAVAFFFAPEMNVWLEPYIDISSGRQAAAFALLFLATLLLAAMVNFLVGRLIDISGLSGTDRMLGMLFGMARGAVVIAALVLLLGYTPIPNDPWWGDSILVGYFEEMAIWLRDLLPSDVAERFRFGIDSVIQTTP